MGMYDEIVVKKDIVIDNVLIEKGTYQTKDLDEQMGLYILDDFRLLDSNQGRLSGFASADTTTPQPTNYTCKIRMYGAKEGIEYELEILNGILIRAVLLQWSEEHTEYLVSNNTKRSDIKRSEIVIKCEELIDERLERYLAQEALNKHQLLLANRERILRLVSEYEQDIRDNSLVIDGVFDDAFIMVYIISPFLEGTIRMAIS